jgi:hypothetical protein
MKKMKKISVLSAIVLASSIVLIYSCKKETKEVDTETQSVVDNAICEQEFMQIQPTTNNMAIKTKGTGATRLATGSELMGGCDTLTYISGDTAFMGAPPTFEFDYSNCTLANVDGVIRTGKVRMTFVGKPKVVNSKTIIKLINYKINNAITYSCDSIVVTTLSNSIPTKSFRVQIIGGMCIGNGWTVKYNSDKTITVNTQSTVMLSDDVTTVTGTASGTNRNGKNFTVNVNSIEKPANCRWITKGTVDVTPDGFSVRTVDFGNGNCDDDATFTVNGQTIAFKLK